MAWYGEKEKEKKKVGTGKLVRKAIQVGIVNNIYDKLFNDEDTKTTVYKTSWILDSVASGHYANEKTMVWDKKKIQPGTGIEIRCAYKGIMNQTGEGNYYSTTYQKAPKKSISFMAYIHRYLVVANLSKKEHAH